MPSPEKFQWLRRDGAPLVISLILHALALLLIAPWLIMRTIPAPSPVTVEVMLEPQKSVKEKKHPEKAARMKRQKLVVRARHPQPKLVKLKPLQVEMEAQPVEADSGRREGGTKDDRLASGIRLPGASSGKPEPGLAASGAPVLPGVSPDELPQNVAGVAALGRTATAPTPFLPSLGAAPQPSAQASALPPRAGEDRQEGTINLAGAVPQSQAPNPEYRQAARLGGAETLRGGSRTPEEGLARQLGSPSQTMLQAAVASPQAIPGQRAMAGGHSAVTQTSATATPGGRASVAAGEGASTIGKATGSLAGQGVPPQTGSGAQAASGLAANGRGTGGTGMAMPGERGAGLAAAGSRSSGSGVPGGGREGLGRSEGGRGEGRGTGGAGAAMPGERGAVLAAAGSGSSGSGVPGGGREGLGRSEGRALATGSGSEESSEAGTLAASAETGTGIAAGRDGTAPQFVAASSVRKGTQATDESARSTLQAQAAQGVARVVEDRYAATAMKVDSPRHVCDLPLMLAGFDRRPIPAGLDTINASAAAALSGETPPRHLPSNPMPRYPLEAMFMHASGQVVVRAEVLPDGQVGHILIKKQSGFAVLDQAALATVRVWRFYPAQRNGMAIAMWLDIPIEYKTP